MTKPAKETIKVESNNALEPRGDAKVASVVDTSHPVGITVETFTGVQRGVNWADKGQ